jgi:hypothetical protein
VIDRASSASPQGSADDGNDAGRGGDGIAPRARDGQPDMADTRLGRRADDDGAAAATAFAI